MTDPQSDPTCVELLPCPFCGSAARLLGGPMAQEVYSVWCTGEGPHHNIGGTMDKAETIRRWNTRAAAAGREVEQFNELMNGPSKDAQIKVWRDRAMTYAEKLDEIGVFVDVGGPAPSESVGWRDIESAPKDGTLVDLWCDAGRVANAGWKDGNWSVLNKWMHSKTYPRKLVPVYTTLEDYDITHWMPLPAPPSAQSSYLCAADEKTGGAE